MRESEGGEREEHLLIVTGLAEVPMVGGLIVKSPTKVWPLKSTS